jgi:hypothetical protein
MGRNATTLGGAGSGERAVGLTGIAVIRSMLIRMTGLGSTIAAFLAGAAMAAGGLAAGSSTDPTPRTALVIDADTGREGSSLVDTRLRDVDAAVRLPRTSAEALTNVRYLAAQGYRLVVAGPQATASARDAGVTAVRASDVTDAVAAAGR